jgi:putative mRNA 3-end processing factor
VEEARRRFLLDYGVKMNDELIAPLPVQGFVDGVILSHAHLDHSGNIPALYSTSESPCYMTEATLPLIDLLLRDSIKVNKLKGNDMLFDETELKRMTRKVVLSGYGKPQTIAPSTELEFRDAGHILGAASISLKLKNRHLVYSGDFKLEETRLHSPAYSGYKDVDALIIESTYGERQHPPRKETEKEFVDECRDVCDSDGNVLIPAFAVGRAQEVISILCAHRFEYPIYLDGMATSAAEIMLDYPGYVRDFKEMYSALKEARWVNSPRDRKDALKGPTAIVSTAGFLQGGPAVSYLLKIKEIPNSALFLSGYQVEHSPGRRLMENRRFTYENFDLDFADFNVQHFDFSAHSDRRGLEEFIKRLSPKVVFVMHGDEPAALSLGKWVDEELGTYVEVPKFGQKFDVEKYL